jgi:hypothetical protein
MPGGESQKGYEEEEDEEELPSSWYLIHRSSTSDDILDAHGRSKPCCSYKSGTFGLTPFDNHHKCIYYVFYCLPFIKVRSERTLIKSVRGEKYKSAVYHAYPTRLPPDAASKFLSHTHTSGGKRVARRRRIT